MSYSEKGDGKSEAYFNVLECPNAAPSHFNTEYPQGISRDLSMQGPGTPAVVTAPLSSDRHPSYAQ